MSGRTNIEFNKGWLFSKEDSLPLIETVDLPHCYNSLDGIDGDNHYYRGKTTYEKSFRDPREAGEELWLEVEAASMVSEVYLNDVLLTKHMGGYSLFRADLTDHLKKENTLRIVVDNSPSEEYYPQKADFTFYGGIYRDVRLIRVPKAHFDLSYYGSNGVKVTPALKDDARHRHGRDLVERKKRYCHSRWTDEDLRGQRRSFPYGIRDRSAASVEREGRSVSL